MRRRFEGLHKADHGTVNELPDGVFLARISRAQYCWHPQKPFYSLRLIVLEPKPYVDRSITGRIYCTAKALWKLTWFLRDFGYDVDLLGHDEIDDKHLVGLQGVVKVSRVIVNGTCIFNFDGLAPAGHWEELSCSAPPTRASGVAS